MGSRRFGLGVACLLLAAPGLAAPARAAGGYRSASADSTGRVEIVTTTGRTILIPPAKEQVGADDITLAPDGRAVGWTAMYPNVATSYPIPLELLVYADGKLHRFRGNELPIWRWRFSGDGTEVAFEQETVHGGIGVHYERRRVRDGRLVAQFTPEADGYGRRISAEGPAWTRDLDQDH
jgi:hypothetical protein